MINQPKKHHYIPVFYLKRWAAADGKIVEFSRHRGFVKPLRKHPDATGYVHRLYEIEGVPAENAQQFEELFLKPVDSLAANTLALMETGQWRDDQWNAAHRSAWSRFILSLLLRTPQDIQQLKALVSHDWDQFMQELQEKYTVQRAQTDPPTVREYLEANKIGPKPEFAMSVGKNLIDHGRIGELINNWFWTTICVADAGLELLTSDRPVLMSATLSEPMAYIIMPIGPGLLFVASNSNEGVQRLLEQRHTDLVKKANTFVVSHAVKYVFGGSDVQWRFVQNRMGSIQQSSLLERLARYRAERDGTKSA